MLGTIWKKKSSVFHNESYNAPVGIVVAVEEDGMYITLRYGDGSNEKISHGLLRRYFTPILPTTPLPHPKE
tara:strand:+ start:368 stop:580 length:213 start_codon:yes stop_codon:yes gene_type:complete